MAIGTYAELKTAVSNWAKRSDTAFTDRVDEFLDLAEAYLNRKLRTLDMEASTTIATVDGTSTVNLPSDFLQGKVLYLAGGLGEVELVAPSVIARTYLGISEGQPKAAALYPGNKLQLGPTPDGVYTLNLTYYQKIPALSGSQTTNWLLTKWPDLYLQACLYEAHNFLMDSARAGEARILRDSLMLEVQKSDKESKGSAISPRIVPSVSVV